MLYDLTRQIWEIFEGPGQQVVGGLESQAEAAVAARAEEQGSAPWVPRVRKCSSSNFPSRYPSSRGWLQVEPLVLPPTKGVVGSLGQIPPLAFSGSERCRPSRQKGRAGEIVTSLPLRGPPPVPAELGEGGCVLRAPHSGLGTQPRLSNALADPRPQRGRGKLSHPVLCLLCGIKQGLLLGSW